MTPQAFRNGMFGRNRTDPNGPAMTWCKFVHAVFRFIHGFSFLPFHEITVCPAMFAIGYLELGNLTAAADYFNKAYQTQKPPFMIFFEGIGGGTPNFITGAG
jgi:hypothetical protein